MHPNKGHLQWQETILYCTRYGRTPCRNKGTCQPLKAEERTLQNLSFRCEWPPAWQRGVCEKSQYTLIQTESVDERDYEPTSQLDPSCVNINECQDEDANPCLNGGVCHDLIPPPMVQAERGEKLRFSKSCRIRKKFNIFIHLWIDANANSVSRGPCVRSHCHNGHGREWGDWGARSVSCGIGTRTRTRTCPRPSKSLGRPEQAGICNGRVLSYENVKNTTTKDGTSDIAYKLEEEKLREVGLLWTEEDDSLLEDAFTWSEQQFGVKRGGRNTVDTSVRDHPSNDHAVNGAYHRLPCSRLNRCFWHPCRDRHPLSAK
eukprot:TsM_001093900 transcript=TsM_001093900 gene=TsM_001093900